MDQAEAFFRVMWTATTFPTSHRRAVSFARIDRRSFCLFCALDSTLLADPFFLQFKQGHLSSSSFW